MSKIISLFSKYCNPSLEKRWQHLHLILCVKKTFQRERNVKRMCCHDTKINKTEAVTCSHVKFHDLRGYQANRTF